MQILYEIVDHPALFTVHVGLGLAVKVRLPTHNLDAYQLMGICCQKASKGVMKWSIAAVHQL